MFVSRQMFSDLCLKVLPWLPFPQSKLLAHFMKEKVRRKRYYADTFELQTSNAIIYSLIFR